jgi:hypothetical protein
VTSPSADAVVVLSFFGQAVIVDASAPSLADLIRTLWQPFVSTTETDVATAVQVAIPPHHSSVADLGWLNSALNSTAMELTPHLAIHAGVLRHRDVVVAFPARSGIGKSTLTGACLREGFDYVSDEALCLSYDNHLAQPYPRPLGLSLWSARELGVVGVPAGDDVLVLPHEFGARSTAVDEPLRLTHVVLPRRIDSRLPASLASLSPAPASEAIEAMLRMSFNHYRRPEDAVRLVASVVAAAHVSVLTYSEAREAAALMAQTFGTRNPPDPQAGSATTGSPLVDELPHP